MKLEQRIFRVKTLPATDLPGSGVRTDVRLRADSLAAARRLADAIAAAEPLWREGDRVEILDADDRTLLVRDRGWGSPADAPTRRLELRSAA